MTSKIVTILVAFLFIYSCKKENHPPTISDQIFQVKENSTSGLVCATISAIDPDGDALIYEQVEKDESLPFEIDKNNGNIRIKQNSVLDFEKIQKYIFKIKVSDGSASALAIITINITDQMENPNVVDQSFEIQENITVSQSLGLVKFESKGLNEEFEFSIVDGNNSNLFFIGEKSGELFLAEGKSLNFETTNKYALQIKIQNKSNTSYYTFIKADITVIDVNEKPIMVDQSLSIPENSDNDTSIGTLIATDPDNNQKLIFTILQSSIENVVKVDANSGKLLVSDKSKLDYEKNSKITLSIKVTDNGSIPLSDTANVIINVKDVDERPSVTTKRLQINENSITGQVVGTVIAKSYFGTPIQYSIISGDGSNKFIIDKNTGIITVAPSVDLNFESQKSYTLNLKVNETQDQSNYINSSITIDIVDVNEPPILSPIEFTVHNIESGSSICGTIQGTDPDIGQLLTYSILDGNSEGYFSIKNLIGEISLIKPVNMPDNSEIEFLMTIKAEDNGSNTLSTETKVRIKVTNQDIPQTGLIAFYPFNGNAMDESDNSYNGNVVGPTLSTDRKSVANRAYSFDGNNDYISLGGTVGNGIRTISLWFKLNTDIDGSLSSPITLISRDGDYNNVSEFNLVFVPNGGWDGTPGKLRFLYCLDKNNYYYIQSNNTVWQKEKWYHVVVLIDPQSGMKMYINNIKQTNTNTSFTSATGSCNLETQIGSWANISNRFFYGLIDDIIIYNRTLTDPEINTLFNQ